MNLLLRRAFTGDALSSDVEAVAIWLARPQHTTLSDLDVEINVILDKDTQQRLRKELLKAVPHLTRSAQQLWRERCHKAALINGTGPGSATPVTVSAYSPCSYVSTMTDYFASKSAEADSPPPARDAFAEPTPDDPVVLSTQSTLWNASQLHLSAQSSEAASVKEWLEIPPATPAGQGKESVTPNYHEV
jgi:hypothetical protein